MYTFEQPSNYLNHKSNMRATSSGQTTTPNSLKSSLEDLIVSAKRFCRILKNTGSDKLARTYDFGRVIELIREKYKDKEGNEKGFVRYLISTLDLGDDKWIYKIMNFYKQYGKYPRIIYLNITVTNMMKLSKRLSNLFKNNKNYIDFYETDLGMLEKNFKSAESFNLDDNFIDLNLENDEN